jgi:hypothetical protein
MARVREWFQQTFWAEDPAPGALAALFRCPSVVPRVYWRRVLGVGWANASLAVALLLYRFLIMRWARIPHAGWFWHLLNLLALFCFLLVPVFYPRRAIRALRSEVLRSDYKICLGCGYFLRGLPDEHVCPECGAPYEIAALRRAWQHWIAHRRLPAPDRPQVSPYKGQ